MNSTKSKSRNKMNVEGFLRKFLFRDSIFVMITHNMNKGVLLVDLNLGQGLPLKEGGRMPLFNELSETLKPQIPICLVPFENLGSVSILNGIKELQKKGIQQILVLFLMDATEKDALDKTLMDTNKIRHHDFPGIDWTEWTLKEQPKSEIVKAENNQFQDPSFGFFCTRDNRKVITVPPIKKANHFIQILSHWIEQWILIDTHNAIA